MSDLPDISDLICCAHEPPKEAAIAYCERRLEACASLEDLRRVWESIAPRYQRAVVDVKDEMKRRMA